MLTLLAFLLLTSAAVAASCPPGTLTGEVTHVRDGDTIEVDGLPIRLQGPATPERNDPRARAATRAMVELVDGRTVRCEFDGEGTHDLQSRGPGHCRAPVRAGLARDALASTAAATGLQSTQAALDGAGIGEEYERRGYSRW